MRARGDGQVVHEAVQELVHRTLVERLEEHGRNGRAARRPFGATISELRSGAAEDEDRMLGGPGQQVLDEVEQPLVG